MKDIAPFGFRAAPEVMDALRKVALQSGRSMNSQITQYVRQGLQKDRVQIIEPKKS